MNTFLLAAISLAVFFQLETVQTAPAHSGKEIAPELKEQAPLPSAEIAGPSEPKKVPKQSPPKLVDYDVHRVAARAAVKVYGWLPADKQPKAISDAEAAKNVPKPLGDYDVERVAAKAAQIVYGWLPKEAQPNMNKRDQKDSIDDDDELDKDDDIYADESGADDIKNDQLDKLSN
uniref:Secreted protein n=1 Tax=Globodera pallida TaxID=36090 RepID=A0A183C0J5_GLOPA